MYSKVTSNLNWGRNTKIYSKVLFPKNIKEIKTLIKKIILFLLAIADLLETTRLILSL